MKSITNLELRIKKMQEKKKRKINNQTGAAMLTSIVFFLFISLAIIFGLVTPSVRGFKISNDSIRSKQSLIFSESGIEDAYFRLKNAKPIDSSTTDSNPAPPPPLFATAHSSQLAAPREHPRQRLWYLAMIDKRPTRETVPLRPRQST